MHPMSKRIWHRAIVMSSFFLILVAVRALCAPAQPRPKARPDLTTHEIEHYNYVLGTQTIGASYGFTNQPRLVETARAIRDMGSNTIKFAMRRNYYGEHGNIATANPQIHSLTELARDEPSHKKVLDMPFAHYLIWAYSFSPGWWDKGFKKEDSDKEYREIYDFAAYLLKTYNGSGKTFYLGHWEGDWHLRPDYNPNADLAPEAIAGMIDWLNVRQKAIEDAKRNVPHRNVDVYHYTEVNLVRKAMQGGATLTNDVLPQTNVDFVSYSSYDSIDTPDVARTLPAALDYIESKLKPKSGITAKRVFIGEYGYAARGISPQRQDENTRRVMRAALKWGCPFVLYWEIYNNEVDDKGQRGFWLINDRGEKQPVYFTHQRFYNWARRYVADLRRKTGHVPGRDEFNKAAAAWLDPKSPTVGTTETK